MSLKRALRFQWLKIVRLQEEAGSLAWGMALGVFIGMTPTVPFHSAAALVLAPLLRVSPVTACLGVWVMNPLTIAPLYVAAYKVGEFLLFPGAPLIFPETHTYKTLLLLLWQGGLALQVGGILIAIPPAIISYFLTLWAVQRYRQQKARKAAGVLGLSQNPSSSARPEP